MPSDENPWPAVIFALGLMTLIGFITWVLFG